MNAIAGLLDQSDQDLLQLLSKPSALASLLQRLLRLLEVKDVASSARSLVAFSPAPQPSPSELHLAQLVALAFYSIRRLRDREFPALFGEPSWDMLLDLYHHHMLGKPITISSCCIASACPPTTALRHLSTMVEFGILRRVKNSTDGRTVFIEFTTEGLAKMDAWAIAASRKIATLMVGPKADLVREK